MNDKLETKQSKAWTYLGQASGVSPFINLSSLSGKATEIFVHVTWGADAITFSKTIPYAFNSTLLQFKDGGYYSSSENYLITIKLDQNSTKITSYFAIVGTDLTHELNVWYR